MSKKCRVVSIRTYEASSWDAELRRPYKVWGWHICIRYGRALEYRFIKDNRLDEIGAWQQGMRYARELKHGDGRYDRKKKS